MARIPLAIRRRLSMIRGLILDVDGVLTDGRLSFGATDESKGFHVRDGHGIVLLLRSGFYVGIISGRSGAATQRRIEELGIRDFFLGVRDKSSAFETLLSRWGVTAEEIGVMGDDVTDIPLLHRAGFAITVADAHPEVRRRAAWITASTGGNGAAREVADALLFMRHHGRKKGEEAFRC